MFHRHRGLAHRLGPFMQRIAGFGDQRRDERNLFAEADHPLAERGDPLGGARRALAQAADSAADRR